MAGVIKLNPGGWTQMMSTELNSLSNGVAVLQSTGTNAAYDNSSNLYFWADFELDVTFGSAPTAGKTVDIYLIPLAQAGGTTYWDSDLSAVPGALFIGSFPVRNVNTAQIVGFRGVPIPPQKFIILLKNSTDQAFPASGSKLYMNTYGEQYS